MKQIESVNLRSKKADKPMLDYRDMCLLLCIICAALITYILSTHEWFADDSIGLAGSVVCFVLAISVSLYWLTQKIVCICYQRAKRKATEQSQRLK